jgi:hypothetical protein
MYFIRRIGNGPEGEGYVHSSEVDGSSLDSCHGGLCDDTAVEWDAAAVRADRHQ